MPQRLIPPIRATGRTIIRGAGVVLTALLLALAFIQADNARTNADAIRQVVRDNHRAQAQRDRENRDAQVKGCYRGNALRAQVNKNVYVVDSFIRLAVQARRGSGDINVAEKYAELLPKLAPLDGVDCEAAYPPVSK